MNARKLYLAAVGWLGAGVVFWLAFAAVSLVDTPVRAGTAGIFDPATLNTTDGRQIFEQICQGCHMQAWPGGGWGGALPGSRE